MCGVGTLLNAPLKDLYVGKRRARLGKARRRLDEVRPRLGHKVACGRLLFIGEKAGLHNDFEELPAACPLHKGDLIADGGIVARLHIAEVDHHVDLVCTR